MTTVTVNFPASTCSMRKKPALSRVVVVTLLSCMVSTGALGAAPDKGSAAEMLETPDQVLTSVLLQSTGAPARVDIADQATDRLTEGSMFIPKDPATKLLKVSGRPVPPDFQGLLIGQEGMDAPGLIRFIPSGFVDSDAALAWTADDLLASLKDTVERQNAERIKNNLQEREARRWVRAPHYNPETHQLSWAALIVPKSAPRESDGEIVFYAVGFGREGYVEITVVSSLQKADEIGHMEDDFLSGLNFRPNRAYSDAQPTDRTAVDGLAGAMGLDSLHKAPTSSNFLAGDTVVPVAGGIVAAIGALSLLIYIRRHMRREARRG
jgi:uncharacterized membrane-anchored protein